MIKKTLFWGGIMFLIFFAAVRPSSAAEVFSGIGGGIGEIAGGLGDFFRAVSW